MKCHAGRLSHIGYGRPPRGGRGLKYHAGRLSHIGYASPPSRGAWIEICTMSN